MPRKRIMVRTSERTEFTKCRQRWAWAYLDRLKPRSSGMNALVFGDMIHRALAEFYVPQGKGKKLRRGMHPAEAFDKLYKTMEIKGGTSEIRVDDSDEQWVNAYELGIEMMENYIREYGQDERYRVVYPEIPFQIDLHDGQGRYMCTYVGTSDALVRDTETGHLGLLEHKTAATISTDHLFLDEQANTYWTLVPMWLREVGILKPDQDLNFMMYNFMRKAKDQRRGKPTNAKGHVLNLPSKEAIRTFADERGVEYKKSWSNQEVIAALVNAGFRKQDIDQLGEPSKIQPAPLFHRQPVERGYHDRTNTYNRILQQVYEMNEVRSGGLDIYKAPSKDCVFCEFKDMCEMDEIGSDITEMRKQAYRTWQPYAAHVWALELTE